MSRRGDVAMLTQRLPEMARECGDYSRKPNGNVGCNVQNVLAMAIAIGTSSYVAMVTVTVVVIQVCTCAFVHYIPIQQTPKGLSSPLGVALSFQASCFMQ